MAAVVVVIIDPVVNPGLDILEALAGKDNLLNLVPHMAEKTLLRDIIPAVSSSGHGLDKFNLLQLLDKCVARVMAALVAVNTGFIVKRVAVFCDKALHRLQHKIHFQAHADLIRENLVGEGVKHCRQITFASVAIEKQISDVAQENPSWALTEYTVDHIGSDVTGRNGLGHAAVWIGFPYRLLQIELLHQLLDLLYVHDDSHVEEPHMDPSGAFVIASEAVSLQDQGELLLVSIGAAFPGRLACTPGVVTGPGDSGNFAELPDFKECW